MTARKVVLILNYPADQQQSMLRFGNALAAQLRSQGQAVSTWTCPQWFGNWVRTGRFGRHAKWLGYIDKYILGSVSMACSRVMNRGALWHIVDHGNAIYGFLLPWNRVVITCHDCIAIEEAFFGRTGERVGRFGLLLQRGIVRGIERAALVVAVSHATLMDLYRLTLLIPSRSTVIHNGLLSTYRRLAENEAQSRLLGSSIPVDMPFVFMIGSNLKRKNRLGAIQSFDCFRRLLPEHRLRLIMAGQSWSDDIRQAAAAAEFGEDIIEAGPVSDEVLEAAYCAAKLVSFPSLAEGFGLPIIEAQACGALVVASNIAPMPEVGGDGALYADPTSPTEYARAMGEALTQQETLRIKASQNVARFTTRDWASAYIAAYARLSGRLR